jgi:hypothetical protein
VVLTAQCELILYQGHENNHNYLRGITKLNIFEEEIGIDLQVRINSAKQFMDANYEWYKFVSDVTNDAKNSNHVFNYFLALLNEVIVSFKFLAYTSLHRVLKKIPGISTDESTSNAKSIDIKLTHVNEVFDFFKSIGHVENMIVALATKYEILKFSEQNNEADELMIELEFLIVQNDFLEYKAQTDKLKNGGCVHEVFKQLLDDISERTTASKLEFESLIEDMKSMDEKELPIKTVSTDSHNITLFPIGEFTFPKTETKKVFEILNISDPLLIEDFEWKFDKIIPIANIYHEIIPKEGYSGGNLANRGLESWKNIHRVRKAFFEIGFYRLK